MLGIISADIIFSFGVANIPFKNAKFFFKFCFQGNSPLTVKAVLSLLLIIIIPKFGTVILNFYGDDTVILAQYPLTQD